MKRSKDGYILIRKLNHPNCTKDGYVLEHRLVVEKEIGRYLEFNEVVHHINGDKLDNNMENLELMKRGQHQSFHVKGKKNPMFGKNHTKQTKEKISKANKGQRKGIKHNKETLEKMSRIRKRYWKNSLKPIGKRNPMYRKKRTKEEKKLISKKTKEGMQKSEKWKNYLHWIGHYGKPTSARNT